MTALSKVSIGLGLVIAVGGTALAQPAPPPPPPTGGGMEPAATDEPKMRLDAALIMGVPQGDLDNADTSPGIGLAFGYTVAPNISVGAGLRYFSVQGAGSGVDVSNYDLDVGGRYTVPLAPTAKGFAEAMLIYSTMSVSANGMSQSESGIGFGARGGAMYAVNSNLNVGGAVSYTTASIDFNGTSGDAAWLGLEGFVSYGF